MIRYMFINWLSICYFRFYSLFGHMMYLLFITYVSIFIC